MPVKGLIAERRAWDWHPLRQRPKGCMSFAMVGKRYSLMYYFFGSTWSSTAVSQVMWSAPLTRNLTWASYHFLCLRIC